MTFFHQSDVVTQFRAPRRTGDRPIPLLRVHCETCVPPSVVRLERSMRPKNEVVGVSGYSRTNLVGLLFDGTNS